jgi:uncharacterized protein
MPVDLPPAHLGANDDVISTTRHWLMQAVVGLNLCPFARRVVEREQLRIQVSHRTDPMELLVDVHQELELLANSSAQTLETSLLVMPSALHEFFDFNDFLGDAEDLLQRLDLEGVIQIASFHPDYQFAQVPAQDIGNYTNRSPYPTLHFLREDSLSEAIDSYGDTDVIVERNQQTMRDLGLAGWRQLMKPTDRA